MNKMYAFWKYDIAPFLLGGEVKEIREDGAVSIVGYTGLLFNPVLIVPLEKGLVLQEKLNKANAEYQRKVTDAKEELQAIVKEITF